MLAIGQFGLGTLGDVESRAFDEMDDVDVVAGADPNDEARAEFAAALDAATYPSYETLLAEHADHLDAVNVVTPHTLHFEQTMAALDRGLSVHLEKPMVTDLGDAVALTEAAAERDAVVQVGYQRHFDPRFRTLREVVESGEIGRPVAANAFLEQDWIEPLAGTWRTDPALSGGGQLYDSGSHLLDALMWTTGTEPGRVAAVVDDAGHDVDVHSSLSLTLSRDGHSVPASVFVTGDGPTSPATRDGLFVWGTDGSVEYGPDGITVRRKGGESTHEDVPVLDFDELTGRKLRAFVETVRGDRENPVPPETGRRVIAATEAAYRASERGETVDVPALLEETRAS